VCPMDLRCPAERHASDTGCTAGWWSRRRNALPRHGGGGQQTLPVADEAALLLAVHHAADEAFQVIACLPDHLHADLAGIVVKGLLAAQALENG